MARPRAKEDSLEPILPKSPPVWASSATTPATDAAFGGPYWSPTTP